MRDSKKEGGGGKQADQVCMYVSGGMSTVSFSIGWWLFDFTPCAQTPEDNNKIES